MSDLQILAWVFAPLVLYWGVMLILSAWRPGAAPPPQSPRRSE